MHCLKCGTEIAQGQVFCETCQRVMERYPVPKDVQLILPKRPVRQADGRSQKRSRTVPQPEEQLTRLRRRNLWLLRLVIALLLVCTALSVLLILSASGPSLGPGYGQNYKTTTEATGR